MPNPQPLPQSTDPDRERLEALAQDLRAGDGDALGPWYELEFARVHRLCSGFLGSRTEADDAAQDAMLRLSRKLHLWDGVRAYVPWRNALVANLCRDRLRSAERRRR
ncbi:MAG: hypothetical protein KDB61_14530, partial [Planctomycetes bacterium]|nr:hypothetical protein [Planctomycetota bacterium]